MKSWMLLTAVAAVAAVATGVILWTRGGAEDGASAGLDSKAAREFDAVLVDSVEGPAQLAGRSALAGSAAIVAAPTAREFLSTWPGSEAIVAALEAQGLVELLDTAPPPPPIDEARMAIRGLLLPDRSGEKMEDAGLLGWPAALTNAWVQERLGISVPLDDVQLAELWMAGEQESRAIWEEIERPTRRAMDEAFAREFDEGSATLQPYWTPPSTGPTTYFATTGVAWNGWVCSVGLDRAEYADIARAREEVRRRAEQRDQRLRQLVRSWR